MTCANDFIALPLNRHISQKIEEGLARKKLTSRLIVTDDAVCVVDARLAVVVGGRLRVLAGG